ncbi:hypothetical protein HQ560_07295, partial [bacterium]|nr:hypothetical protein [bacterium]
MPTNDLHRRLAALRGRLRRLILVAGVSRVVLVLLAALAAALLLDWSSRLETPGRVILLAVTVAMVVHTLWCHLLVPLRLRLGQDEMALLVERRFPELRDRLISTVQLARAGASTALSTALIGELEHETLAQASGMDFHAVVSPRKPLLFAAAAAGTLLLAGLFTGAFPETASIFSARFFNPFSLVEWPRATKLSLEATDSHGHPLPVEDGDHILMPKGEDLVLRVRAAGRKGRIWSAPAKVVVHYAFDAGGSGRRNVPQGDDAVYPTTFPTVIEAFTFHVEGGDDATQSYHVTVRNRPRIENVRVTLRAPAYTGEPDRVQDDGRGAIVGLAGAAATVEITTSKPVAATVGSARLIIDDGKPLPMAFVGDDPTRLTGSFVLAAGQRRYAIEVVDTEDLLNAPPASYRLDVRADRVPTVKLPSPGRNKKVTARATVPVHVLAEDDYAVRRLRFVHRQGEKAKPVAHALPDPTDDAKKLERRHAWDLSPLGLKEADSLLVHAEAEDAYTAAVDGGKTLGPNVGRSPAYTLTVVSEAEMASILREKQQELKQRLRKVIERQDKSKSEVDRLAAEAAKETADRRKVGVAERGQRRIATTTENVAAELDTVLDEMRNNKVGNLGEQQRVETLAKTLRQTADKDMPEAARHIARAAQTDEKTQQQKLLADASAKQQDVLDTLRSALARFDQWHDIDELLKMANELLIQQKKLNTRTAELGRALIGKPVDKLTPTEKGTARSLARAQQAARDAMHSLETRMAEVAKALGRNDPAAAKLVEQALSQAISDQIRRKMDDAATRIEGARPATARQLQADATAALERLIKTLSRATSPYLARDLRKLQEDVGRQLKAIEKLLADEKKQLAETAVANLRRGIQKLRKQQADTRDKTAKSATPDELKKQAPDQNQHAEQADSLSRDAKRSAELAEKTQAPLEQAGKELDAASKEMDKARTDLADAKKDPAQAAQDKAIEHLDKADADLADLQKALAQGKAEKPRLGERAKKQGETAKE